jgi:hypothetical protein
VIQTQLGPNGLNAVIYDKGQLKVTVTTGTTVDLEYDELTGELITVTRELVPAGTAGSALDPLTGEYSVVNQINQFYAIKTTRRPTTLGTGDDARQWEDIVNWSWPPVLQAINFFAVERKDGSLLRMGFDINFKEGYSGPCKALITESWSPTAITAPTLTPMIPTPMEFDFPATNLAIPSCLHPELTFTEVVGSSHPTLHAATTSKTFAATNYTDWPSAVVAGFSQTPYSGGYRIRSTLIYKPA